MAQQPARPAWNYSPGGISRILMFVACILFVVASLAAGGVIDESPWAFGFGGFAAVALSWTGI